MKAIEKSGNGNDFYQQQKVHEEKGSEDWLSVFLKFLQLGREGRGILPPLT